MTDAIRGRHVVVTRDYVAQYPDPITVAAGAVVRVERDDPEFPGWLFTRAPDGAIGWLPASHVTRGA